MNKLYSAVLLSVVVIMVVLLAQEKCLAQVKQPNRPAYQMRLPVHKLKNSQNPEFRSERLKQPVDLSEIPPFPGKKMEFVTGTIFPAVKGGPSVTMQFSVRENPKDVLNWYKANFILYKWQLQENMTGFNGVAAMKSHNICQVMTLGPSKRGAKCDFLLRYKFYKATDFSAN